MATVNGKDTVIEYGEEPAQEARAGVIGTSEVNMDEFYTDAAKYWEVSTYARVTAGISFSISTTRTRCLL